MKPWNTYLIQELSSPQVNKLEVLIETEKAFKVRYENWHEAWVLKEQTKRWTIIEQL